jgi:hypothetical protein
MDPATGARDALHKGLKGQYDNTLITFMFFKKTSRKVEISYEVSDPLSQRLAALSLGFAAADEVRRLVRSRQDRSQIRLDVRTATASFSSDYIKIAAPTVWTTERERWVTLYESWAMEYERWKRRHARDWTNLSRYELALAELDGRLVRLRLLAPTLTERSIEPESQEAPDCREPFALDDAGAPAGCTPTSERRHAVFPNLLRLILEVARAEYRRRLDHAVLALNRTLDEVERYRGMVGVAPTPVGFHARVANEIRENYPILALHVREEQARLLRLEPRRPAPLLRSDVDQESLAAIIIGPTPLIRIDERNDREYALYRGSVWESERALELEQWRLLADACIEKEDIEFAQALGNKQIQSKREPIPSAVRRAVWQRDNGRCAQCGSRERLEFDHIVPIARGGSNTERNIELLCESCNRQKSDSIQ